MNWAAIISAKIVQGRRGSSASGSGARSAPWVGAVGRWRWVGRHLFSSGSWGRRLPRSRPGTLAHAGKFARFGFGGRLTVPLGTVGCVLAGRETERAAIAAVLDAARGGTGWRAGRPRRRRLGQVHAAGRRPRPRLRHDACCARPGWSRSPRWRSPPCSGCCWPLRGRDRRRCRRRRRTALRAALGEADGDGRPVPGLPRHAEPARRRRRGRAGPRRRRRRALAGRRLRRRAAVRRAAAAGRTGRAAVRGPRRRRPPRSTRPTCRRVVLGGVTGDAAPTRLLGDRPAVHGRRRGARPAGRRPPAATRSPWSSWPARSPPSSSPARHRCRRRCR